MDLKFYLSKYRIPPTEFAARCGVCVASIHNYIAKSRIPRQKIAEKIEKISDGLVTVKELRGKDDREKKRTKHTVLVDERHY